MVVTVGGGDKWWSRRVVGQDRSGGQDRLVKTEGWSRQKVGQQWIKINAHHRG